jgi:hypothetical protein
VSHQTVVFWKRDFSKLLTPLQVSYKVGPYSHSVIGGPKLAEITVTGTELDLWELAEYARCPVQIFSDKGDAVWWGFVAEIKIDVGLWSVGVNIDSMTNYVGVAYEDDADKGQPKKTAWAEAADSTLEYGRREILFTSSGSNSTHALAARDKYLAEKKYPIPVIIPREKGPNGTILYCRGWFDTLAWRYYLNAGINLVDTATQISAMITSCGEFITSISLETTSGITTAETRDGNGNGLYEITELLKMGTSNYRRLLCEVMTGRRLRIYEEPTLPVHANFILRDGSLQDPYNTVIRKETCPVGIWTRLKDIVPSSVDVTKLSDPTIMFIDEAEYIPDEDRLNLTPRGFIDPFEIGRPNDG